MRKREGKSLFWPITAAILIAGVFLGLSQWENVREKAELLLEKRRITEAARRYFEAEMRLDYREVYRSLAPSSVYRKTTSYQDYLLQAGRSENRIIKYEIVRISHLTGNHDPAAYPGIERFARVEVDLVIGNNNTSERTEVNFDYIFFKEGGKWYKG